ncbi:MAG: phosphate acetyltransferase [Clostridia bacterium]
MTFIDTMKEKARKDIKNIVLPEADDVRVLKATEMVLNEGFANIILIGDTDEIKNLAKENDIKIDGVQIINPLTSTKLRKYSDDLYELRKAKGMTIEQAQELLKTNSRYFATMMVKSGDADGFVSGANHPTSDTLRPALQILKTAPNTKLVSAFFVMVVPECDYGENGIFVFADCGLNEYPDAEALSEIAISSAESFKELVGKEPKVAMLSYSTMGSAHSPLTEKVVEATKLLKSKKPNLICDGEIQLDAAILPEIAERKAPNSPLKGKSNILIFPDLDAGNIGYKLTQRFGKAEAYGPLCQGISKAVNDLSRGCSSSDIAGVVAITAVQAQNIK